MDNSQEITKVGVGVMIVKEGNVLLGKRKNAHGEGTYCFPGGHLEHLESFEDAARRETLEECGLEIDNIRFMHVANIDTYAPKHYVNIGFVADWKSGEPCLLEPEKCEGWDWYPLEALPQPLFFQTALILNSYKKDIYFYDKKNLENL